MTVRERITLDFGVDLPIKGGIGNSIDNPIIIERVGMNNYVGTEYEYLKYIGIGRGVKWQTVSQTLMSHKDKKIDQIKIEVEELTDTEVITTIENYYFDITECIRNGITDNNNEKVDNKKENEELEMVESMFSDLQQYMKFYTVPNEVVVYSPNFKSEATLTIIEKDKWRYILEWLANGKYIGDYVKPFKPTTENINTFNSGCKKLAHWLRVYVETGDINLIPEDLNAFGELTYKE